MTAMPAEITYGYVTGRFIAAWTDGPDAGRLPDPRPLEGLTVKITPKTQFRRLAGASPVLVATMPVTCGVDADGVLIDAEKAEGVWLVTGAYEVKYTHGSVSIPAHDIEVTDAHTEDTPLDLVTAMPPGGPVLTASQYAELSARIDALGSGSGGTGAVSSVNGKTGAVTLNAADVGAATTAQGAKADTAVQPAGITNVIREGDSRLTDTRTPKAHTHTAGQVSGLSTVAITGSYADLSGKPTIPGPQTLSISGSNLSLSGGGGTVTLPSGAGGGGTGWTPAAGRAVGAAQVITGGAYEWTILQYDAPTEPVADLTWNATSNGWVINTAGWYECRYLFRRPDNSPVNGVSMWIGAQASPDFGHPTAAWSGESTGASIARNSFTHHAAVYATPGQVIRTAIAFDASPTNRSGGAFFIYRVA